MGFMKFGNALEIVLELAKGNQLEYDDCDTAELAAEHDKQVLAIATVEDWATNNLEEDDSYAT